MSKLKYVLGGFLLISACVSEQEQREATYRYEEVMRNQCGQTLGFPSGTEGYMNCRMFYDEVFEYAGLNGTKSFSRVGQIQKRIEERNNECRRYWGQDGITRSALWSCIQKKENAFIDEAIHQKHSWLYDTLKRNVDFRPFSNIAARWSIAQWYAGEVDAANDWMYHTWQYYPARFRQDDKTIQEKKWHGFDAAMQNIHPILKDKPHSNPNP